MASMGPFLTQMGFSGGGGGQAPPAEDAGASEAEEKKEEKTNFDIELAGFDAKSKIKVIKEVRSLFSLGLKEAKDMVEGSPVWIKKDTMKEEAEEIKEKLESVGA